jgi:hypothetical protein
VELEAELIEWKKAAAPWNCDAPPAAELSNTEQDQMLHLALWLLLSVEQAHRKKFYKHFVQNCVSGVYLSSCSHTGWKGGRYAVDAPLLARIWRAIHQTVNIRRVTR